MKSEFAKNPRGKAFSFGISREAYSKVYQKGGGNTDRGIPGPGTYNANDLMGKGVPKYSLRARSSSKAYQLTPQSYPGPGAYESRPTITKEGKMLMSKYRSSGATTFNPPRSARFGGAGSKH